MNWDEKLKALQKPFNYSDIQWRIGKTDKKEMKGLVFAYVSNRAIQNRFDEVFGINGWKNEFKEWHTSKQEFDLEHFIKIASATKYKTKEEVAESMYKEHLTQSQLCGISIWDEDKKEWITKWDGADETNFESTKGGLSNSQKRAAAQFGVGRYLYDLPSRWVEVESSYGSYIIKKGHYPKLPTWAYDKGSITPMQVGILEKKAKEKGVAEDKIVAKYFKQSFGELDIIEFKQISDLLEKYENVHEGEEPRLKNASKTK